MQATFGTFLEFEVLHGVRHIGLPAIKSRPRSKLVKELPRRPDKRRACQILLVTGLFANDHQRRVVGAMAGHDLRRGPVQRAAGAGGEPRVQQVPRCGLRHGLQLFANAGDTGGFQRRRGSCHFAHARLCVGDQAGDELRLWQVFPIFLRHL